MKTPLQRNLYSKFLFLVALLLTSFSFSSPCSAREELHRDEFALEDGQTVLFLGDSITYGDMYIQYLDAYLYVKYPQWNIKLINRGIPSETCAGTSEPTHDPPRPDVHTRLDRTLKTVKPDVVFICYGMNDGIYRSPNAEVLEKYKAGMTRLVGRVREATKAKVIVLTPPPFDYRPFANKQKPADQAQPDYRFPAPDYDRTLASFAKWLITQRTTGLKVPVIDLHTILSEVLKERRYTEDGFHLAGDGIHPGPSGHWLMAQAILEGLHAHRVEGSSGTKATSESEGELAWKDEPLPLPFDPRIEAGILGLADSHERLLYYRLQIHQLSPSASYELRVGDEVFGTATGKELDEGIKLANYPDFPLNKTSQEVLKLVQQRRQILRDVWIISDPSPRLAGERERLLKTSKSTAEQAKALDVEIRKLCQPKELKIIVTRKDEE